MFHIQISNLFILLTYTVTKKENFVAALRKTPTSFLEACVCFLSIWSIITLTGFHTYLIGVNKTTNEDIKVAFSSKKGAPNKNPYTTNSLFKNCFVLLCAPNTPRYQSRSDRRIDHIDPIKSALLTMSIPFNVYNDQMFANDTLSLEQLNRRSRVLRSESSRTDHLIEHDLLHIHQIQPQHRSSLSEASGLQSSDEQFVFGRTAETDQGHAADQ